MLWKVISFILICLITISNFQFVLADEIIPDIILSFQSASYLTDKDLILDTYNCDKTKPECKVNFDLSDTFWWYVSTKFACENNFSFVTWEEVKCNPNTITFPIWTFLINFKIYEKDIPTNFKEKSITIINEIEQEQTVTSSWATSSTGSLEEPILEQNANSWSLSETWSTNSGSLNPETGTWITSESWSVDSGTWSENIDLFNDSWSYHSGYRPPEWQTIINSWWQNSAIDIPTVDIEIQSWLELINFKYKCKENDCKVNLNLEKLFTWSFESKNYSCEWKFWSGIFTTIETDKKCNPWYVNYGTWNFYIEAKISEKSNVLNFKTWSLEFSNWVSEIFWDIETSTWWEDEIDNQTWSTDNWSWGENSWNWNLLLFRLAPIIIEIPDANIEVQSWLDLVNWVYKCKDTDCKVNLNLENLFTGSYESKNYSCIWNFWSWTSITLDTDKKCNPWYVSYLIWSFNIEAQIYEKDNPINFKTWSLFFENLNSIVSNNSINYINWVNQPPKAKITLQWKIWNNKELVLNKIICKNTKKCSINFDWSWSTAPNNDKLFYYWIFWNWEFLEKENPKSIEYWPWKYRIKLKVTDKLWLFSEDYFLVEVYENKKEIIDLNENITQYIKIIEALPNPIWNEENEWVKIKNDSLNFVNIKWLEIDDKIWKWSKVYMIIDDFYLFPYQEKKLYKPETKLNFNNNFDEVNLIYNDKIIDTLSWNYEVPEWFVVKKELREKVKVISVIDWDTIIIQFIDWTKEKLRFIWVDTPETKHPKKEVEKFWIEAYNFTKDNLNWKEVEIELDASNYRDKYGRLLGYVWFQDKNFNKIIIEKWYGRVYLYFPFKYSEEFAKAEKEAKKNKLWIWGNNAVILEIEELKKLEKIENLENMKFQERLWFNSIISRISNGFNREYYKKLILNNHFFSYFTIWSDDKELRKERLKEFDLLLSFLLKRDKETLKAKNNKQEKILSYKTSKLKSGLKITWVTFPNSIVTITFDDEKLETKSDKTWNYTFLIANNLKVWKYELKFLVSNWWQYYNYLAPRSLVLSKDYIFWVQDYMVKQSNKKLKTKKVKKTKNKKLLSKNTAKKMKYDVKDIKKEENESSSWKNIILIFIITLLVSVMWFFVVKRID